MKNSSHLNLIKKTFYAFTTVTLVFLLTLLFRGARLTPYRERTDYVLDTYVTVKIYDYTSRTEKDLEQVFKILRSYERTFNFYDPQSELSRLNRELEQKGSLKIENEELKKAIALSLDFARLTHGAFDPSLGNLTLAWAFDRGGRLPGQDELTLARLNSGFKNLNFRSNTLIATRPVKLDLGGIVKGYCIDRVAKWLKDKGYRKFLINSVSSTYTYNELDDEAFRIGIEHPRKEGLLGVIKVKGSETVSTSADNQKFFISKGRRYHHLLDPQTGYPARGFISLTVVAKKSAAATDALSTALFVMGPQKAVAFARDYDLKIVGLTENGKLIIYPQGDWFELAED